MFLSDIVSREEKGMREGFISAAGDWNCKLLRCDVVEHVYRRQVEGGGGMAATAALLTGVKNECCKIVLFF
jgi:hypothetical protein